MEGVFQTKTQERFHEFDHIFLHDYVHFYILRKASVSRIGNATLCQFKEQEQMCKGSWTFYPLAASLATRIQNPNRAFLFFPPPSTDCQLNDLIRPNNPLTQYRHWRQWAWSILWCCLGSLPSGKFGQHLNRLVIRMRTKATTKTHRPWSRNSILTRQCFL